MLDEFSPETGLPTEEALSGVRTKCRELAARGNDPDTIVSQLAEPLGFDPDVLYLIAHAEVGRVAMTPYDGLRGTALQ